MLVPSDFRIPEAKLLLNFDAVVSAKKGTFDVQQINIIQQWIYHSKNGRIS